MAQPYLSLSRAKELIVEIVKTSPRGKTNPRASYEAQGETFHGACVYDDDNGNHCIVGEILVRSGIPLPDQNVNFLAAGLALLDKGYLARETVNWLAEVQRRFDGFEYPNGKQRPRTWRRALEVCRKEQLL